MSNSGVLILFLDSFDLKPRLAESCTLGLDMFKNQDVHDGHSWHMGCTAFLETSSNRD